MKKLPILKRPFFAKRILEIGGGHDPYQGVTHAVDKFPDDNTQRASQMVLAHPDVIFREGELEAIPFYEKNKFEFLYASHVLEHVTSVEKAISEINRVAERGYIETPSPLREQIGCPYPFDASADFHTLFCWAPHEEANTLHTIQKSQSTLGEFCGCENGRLASLLFRKERDQHLEVEPLLPKSAKTTQRYFSGRIHLVEHRSFSSACATGHCAYESARFVRFWSSPLLSWTAVRFQGLSNILK